MNSLRSSQLGLRNKSGSGFIRLFSLCSAGPALSPFSRLVPSPVPALAFSNYPVEPKISFQALHSPAVDYKKKVVVMNLMCSEKADYLKKYGSVSSVYLNCLVLVLTPCHQVGPVARPFSKSSEPLLLISIAGQDPWWLKL